MRGSNHSKLDGDAQREGQAHKFQDGLVFLGWRMGVKMDAGFVVENVGRHYQQ